MREQNRLSAPNAPAAVAGAIRGHSIATLAKQTGEKATPLAWLLFHGGAESFGELLDGPAAFREVALQALHDCGFNRWRKAQPPSGFIEPDWWLGEELLK